MSSSRSQDLTSTSGETQDRGYVPNPRDLLASSSSEESTRRLEGAAAVAPLATDCRQAGSSRQPAQPTAEPGRRRPQRRRLDGAADRRQAGSSRRRPSSEESDRKEGTSHHQVPSLLLEQGTQGIYLAIQVMSGEAWTLYQTWVLQAVA